MAAGYVPNYFPGDAISATAGAAITGGQLVYVSAANTVSPTTAATGSWLGVAADNADLNTLVSVMCEGVHTLAASGTVNAGDVVVPAAAGAVASIGAGTTYSQVVGVAMTGTSRQSHRRTARVRVVVNR